jgi:hypothetical protein
MKRTEFAGTIDVEFELDIPLRSGVPIASKSWRQQVADPIWPA